VLAPDQTDTGSISLQSGAIQKTKLNGYHHREGRKIKPGKILLDSDSHYTM
jgi:hypothetical protein